MEAAVCGAKAIALSYAFFDRNHDPDIINGASALSARIIEHLYNHWDPDVHLYSVNVPLVDDVAGKKILYTDILQNTWRSGSCFTSIPVPDDADATADEVEAAMRRAEERQGRRELAGGGGSGEGIDSGRDTPVTGGGGAGAGAEAVIEHMRFAHQHFKWAPRFKDVYQSVEESEEGNDGWAVAQGYTSVTPLRANFMHVGGRKGEEIKLG